MDLGKYINKFLFEKTHREVIINTIGNYANIFFSFLYVVIIARLFTPSDYGTYIVVFSLVYVLTNIFDFGVSATIYSYLPSTLTQKNKSYSFLKVTLLYQTILSSLAVVILFLLIDPINASWLKLNIPLKYYLWAFGSIPLLLWQNFALNTLYASRRFFVANILILLVNVTRLGLLLSFYYFGALNLEWLFIIFGPLGSVVFLLLLWFAHPNFPGQLLKAPLEKSHLNIGYSITFFISTQLYFVASRLDLFIIAHFMSKSEVGYYGLAQKVIFSILTTVNSITQVLSPQFSVARTRTQVMSLMKRFAYYCIIPVLLLVGAVLTPSIIYQTVFGVNYASMIDLVRILGVVNIFFIVMQIPMLFFLYTINKPRYVLICNLILLVVIGLGSYYLIIQIGLFGPPIAILASYLLVTIFGYNYFRREYNKLPF